VIDQLREDIAAPASSVQWNGHRTPGARIVFHV